MEELTETGRNIGGTVYTLTTDNDDPLDVLDPTGNGIHRSYIALNLVNEDPANVIGKFALIGFILQNGGLAAPLAVYCVELK